MCTVADGLAQLALDEAQFVPAPDSLQVRQKLLLTYMAKLVFLCNRNKNCRLLLAAAYISTASVLQRFLESMLSTPLNGSLHRTCIGQSRTLRRDFLDIGSKNLGAQNYQFSTTSYFRVDSVDTSESIFTKL